MHVSDFPSFQFRACIRSFIFIIAVIYILFFSFVLCWDKFIYVSHIFIYSIYLCVVLKLIIHALLRYIYLSIMFCTYIFCSCIILSLIFYTLLRCTYLFIMFCTYSSFMRYTHIYSLFIHYTYSLFVYQPCMLQLEVFLIFFFLWHVSSFRPFSQSALL